MGITSSTLRKRVITEASVFAGLLFFGVVLLPVLIYFVGTTIFGDYAGEGYGDFFGALSTRLFSGETSAWFLVFSPYLAIIIFRLMAWGWRQSAQA